ncbi:hypothetical protein [Leptospira borgpetersenii]|uniref:Uncharacterized protein n=2 Tax=Leptospira borgpetersenii TaxID=174 RepID=A0AAV3JB35_LEPBO|nr:hypothetical protein [Leptospira borgpetersenii]AXX16962.1 hypothetical protein C4Q31_16855 [Leptospira borgpetersenii serovar Ceylonica]EKQ93796.1 hypothetical protein LEP1GSC101_1888 [Leptospira borgpetersenii str. UI 09149]EMN13523.1 hypothetical protein LEP1GSC055_0591 [Leptospira borgpetersenii str. Brem 307]EMN16997.1 hypothetical protein LEP1GSC056_2588 [Leptospira borgpetersenii str. Brem 328]EMN57251.1 hypothetical protein LEP1GSC090_2478 [Leptospira borgpetersenii serovar Javanica
MSLKTAKDWNQFLLRLFIAFGFWEVISVPLRSLLFSRFYYDSIYKNFFQSVGMILWVGPILADLVQVFFLGVIVRLAKNSLPVGIVGGLIVAICFSLAAYVGPAISILNFVNVLPSLIVWLWVFSQFLLTLLASLILTYIAEEEA